MTFEKKMSTDILNQLRPVAIREFVSENRETHNSTFNIFTFPGYGESQLSKKILETNELQIAYSPRSSHSKA